MIFSIFLFGAGKSILEIKITPKKRTKNAKTIFVNNLPIAVSFPELVLFVNCL